MSKQQTVIGENREKIDTNPDELVELRWIGVVVLIALLIVFIFSGADAMELMERANMGVH